MDAAVFLDQRFFATPDGVVWTADSCAGSFFGRYLAVFDRLHLVARVQQVDTADPRWVRASGPGVEFVPVPCYLGPSQYLARAKQVRDAARGALEAADAVVLRAPSSLSLAAAYAGKHSGSSASPPSNSPTRESTC